MIHRRKGRKLKRTASHRKATLASLSTSVLRHKKIRTTVAKAKEARLVVEKIITRAKHAVVKEKEGGAKDVHARREVARVINDRAVVKTLFEEIAPKVIDRPGGYTRVVKLGKRFGDAADMAILELVDYNTGKEEKKQPARPRRTRRTPGKKQEPGHPTPAGATSAPATGDSAAATAEPKAETPTKE